jgi:hypothetical protein
VLVGRAAVAALVGAVTGAVCVLALPSLANQVFSAVFSNLLDNPAYKEYYRNAMAYGPLVGIGALPNAFLLDGAAFALAIMTFLRKRSVVQGLSILIVASVLGTLCGWFVVLLLRLDQPSGLVLGVSGACLSLIAAFLLRDRGESYPEDPRDRSRIRMVVGFASSFLTVLTADVLLSLGPASDYVPEQILQLSLTAAPAIAALCAGAASALSLRYVLPTARLARASNVLACTGALVPIAFWRLLGAPMSVDLAKVIYYLGPVASIVAAATIVRALQTRVASK